MVQAQAREIVAESTLAVEGEAVVFRGWEYILIRMTVKYDTTDGFVFSTERLAL